MVALHVTVPDALQPERLNVQFRVPPLTCVGDWNVPESVLWNEAEASGAEKEVPVIGIDVAGNEVMVIPEGQFGPRLVGKLTP